MATYYGVLEQELKKAKPATGFSRAELVEQIDKINELLRGSVPNFERIGLCADRASLRKALEALPSEE